MFNTYKHVLTLTFASCLLNNQLQAPMLIFINTVPSVSYCSTVMLYLTDFVMCILVTALPTGGRGRQPTPKLNIFIYSPERCLCHITFCNYKCINISLFTTGMPFFKSTCNELEWNPVCWRWSISPSCNIIWFSCCSMGLSQLAFLKVWYRMIK